MTILIKTFWLKIFLSWLLFLLKTYYCGLQLGTFFFSFLFIRIKVGATFGQEHFIYKIQLIWPKEGWSEVVSCGSFLAFYVNLFPLECILNIPPHVTCITKNARMRTVYAHHVGLISAMWVGHPVNRFCNS